MFAGNPSRVIPKKLFMLSIKAGLTLSQKKRGTGRALAQVHQRIHLAARNELDPEHAGPGLRREPSDPAPPHARTAP
jgi:hypothetical protein